jgi:hypothetical protein
MKKTKRGYVIHNGSKDFCVISNIQKSDGSTNGLRKVRFETVKYSRGIWAYREDSEVIRCK